MKQLIDSHTKNYMAVIAIGDEFFAEWKRFAYPLLEQYCRRHGIGLLVFDQDLVSKEDRYWKKATWQKMLIGKTVLDSLLEVNHICYIDADILVNPFAPNIFDEYNSETIGLVSLRKRLPYPYWDVLRRIAFNRNKYYSSDYPLDSALFLSLKDLYAFHGLEEQTDEACMGLILFNPKNHSEIMKSWFEKYDKNIKSVTGGGDQTHINFEIQNWGKVSWLDYRFQAIWVFEMAWKYPFLYKYNDQYSDVIKECIEASLESNFFLHFAGSWHESNMWKIQNVFSSTQKKEELESFHEYLKIPVTGKPLGMIKPKS